MPNLISQMRNGLQPQPQPQQLNNIDQVKNLMNTVRMSANPQQYLVNIINQNPMLASMLKNGNNLQAMAQQMAQARGIDLNQLIADLQR